MDGDYYRLNVEKVQELITGQDLKKWWVAESVGIHKTTLRRWLSGRIDKVSWDRLDRLANVLSTGRSVYFAPSLNDARQRFLMRLALTSHSPQAISGLGSFDYLSWGNYMKFWLQALLSVFVSLFWAGVSHAWDQHDFSIQKWGEDLKTAKQHLEKDWKDSSRWKGTLCDGRYDYLVKVKADLLKVDFELDPDGVMFADTLFEKIYGGAKGSYRSQKSACIPLSGWTGINIDNAKVRARITFTGTGESLEDVEVRIVSTQLGTVHLGTAVPAWFEDFLTRQLNRALTWVWKHELGDWISKKVTSIVKSKIPQDPQMLGAELGTE